MMKKTNVSIFILYINYTSNYGKNVAALPTETVQPYLGGITEHNIP